MSTKTRRHGSRARRATDRQTLVEKSAVRRRAIGGGIEGVRCAQDRLREGYEAARDEIDEDFLRLFTMCEPITMKRLIEMAREIELREQHLRVTEIGCDLLRGYVPRRNR